MSSDKNFLKIRYNRSHQSIKGEVKAIDFQQDGHYIIYVPSLGLSAYGNDVIDARQMLLDLVIPDFCQTLLEQPLSKIIYDLKDLGWDASPFFRTELSTSAHIDIDGILKDFDLPENTIIHESLVAV